MHGKHFVFHSFLVLLLLFTFLVLELVLLDHVQLSGQAFHLILVLIDLCLVHVDFGCHGLQLFVLFVQCCLHRVHFLHIDIAGTFHDVVLQFFLHFFFFVQSQFFFHNFFCLRDEAFLQILNFFEQFVSLGVSSFKPPPSVDILRIFEFFGQSLDLDLFLEQLLLEMVDLFLEWPDAHVFLVGNLLLGLEVLDDELEDLDVVALLGELLLAFLERVFHDADLLVEQRQFVVASNQVCAQLVALVHHLFVFLLQPVVF